MFSREVLAIQANRRRVRFDTQQVRILFCHYGSMCGTDNQVTVKTYYTSVEFPLAIHNDIERKIVIRDITVDGIHRIG